MSDIRQAEDPILMFLSGQAANLENLLITFESEELGPVTRNLRMLHYIASWCVQAEQTLQLGDSKAFEIERLLLVQSRTSDAILEKSVVRLSVRSAKQRNSLDVEIAIAGITTLTAVMMSASLLMLVIKRENLRKVLAHRTIEILEKALTSAKSSSERRQILVAIEGHFLSIQNHSSVLKISLKTPLVEIEVKQEDGGIQAAEVS